ncbi:MAG: hypothetical protein B6U69_02690 [Thermofilum sp. ex4484_15]|nr:MAG: hypothetical protein B6U69_02690 [Thermofilum sp. ex4484_15]
MIRVGITIGLEGGKFKPNWIREIRDPSGLVAEVRFTDASEFGESYIGDLLDLLEELPIPISALKLPSPVTSEVLERGMFLADQVGAKYLIVSNLKGVNLSKEVLKDLTGYALTLCFEKGDFLKGLKEVRGLPGYYLALAYDLSSCESKEPLGEVMEYIGYIKVLRAFNRSPSGTKLPLFHPEGLWNLNGLIKALSKLPREVLLVLDYDSDFGTYLKELNRIRELTLV